MAPLPQGRSTLQRPSTTDSAIKRGLYVASASPYFFNAYRFPLTSGEQPALTESGVDEPVPITVDSRDLYVGSFDDGTIYTYPLPLSVPLQPAAVAHGPYIPPFSGKHPPDPSAPLAMSEGIPSGLGDLSGLAVSGGYLYVAGSGAAGNEVLEYRLPLVLGETPSGSVTGFSTIDFLGIATRNRTLYVASTTAGTVAAYRLPLSSGECPEYTIMTAPQIDGAVGVALDSKSHLFVSLFTTGDIYEYRLPYHDGESPTILDVRSQTGGNPYGIAVRRGKLFVTAGEILAYRLPISPSSTPYAIVPFSGFPTGVAAEP